MSNLNKYIWIAWVSARSNLAYLGDVAGRILFLTVILYILLCLWKVTYAASNANSLGGLTLCQMLWYLTITESIMLSAPRVAQLVDEEVRTGSLAVQLVRPISYPLYRLWSTIGERLVRFTLSLAVGAGITLVLVGPIAVEPIGLVIFVIGLPLAFVLDFLGNFLIGLGAFWLEDTSGLVLLYSRITMVLGGMLIPLELVPDFVRPALKALPFASIVYGPAHLFVQPGWTALGELLMRQSLSVVALTVAVLVVYNRALRRVYSHGG